jgi:hypothetical protein
MRTQRFFAVAFSTVALAAIAVPTFAQTTRPDQTLRNSMTSGFRSAATTHGVSADLTTLGLESLPTLFVGAVGTPPSSGPAGALAGQNLALAYIDGSKLALPKGYYGVEIDANGEALLTNSSGVAVARGTSKLNLTAGTSQGCNIEQTPLPNEGDIVCINCQFGHPSIPGSGWAFATCFQMQIFP